MSQRTTDVSSIMYHSPLLACKERISGDELHGFLTKNRQKTAEPRVHQNKSNPDRKQPGTLATSNTAVKVYLSQHAFFPC